MGRKLYRVVLTDEDRERLADEFERAWRQRCEMAAAKWEASRVRRPPTF
ncbi:MAG: hypothetical protein PHX83_07130 [Acidobacteriia bacterium]|nr:hypothetical protein [Terriglobia bacterium]